MRFNEMREVKETNSGKCPECGQLMTEGFEVDGVFIAGKAGKQYSPVWACLKCELWADWYKRLEATE